jgi:hypothetical protein
MIISFALQFWFRISARYVKIRWNSTDWNISFSLCSQFLGWKQKYMKENAQIVSDPIKESSFEINSYVHSIVTSLFSGM